MQGTYIDHQDLHDFLSGNLPEQYWAQNRRIFAELTDESIYLPTHEELKQFLTANPLRVSDDLGEGFDCDDFAFILKGRASEYGRRVLKLEHSMCFGIVWGCFDWIGKTVYHACNWVVENDMTFYWVEPQTGEWHITEKCTGGLTLMIA